jgi:hypothetical protein
MPLEWTTTIKEMPSIVDLNIDSSFSPCFVWAEQASCSIFVVDDKDEMDMY